MYKEYRQPRKIEYFESPQEILAAIFDAISEHQRVWKCSGTIHGNINPDTLFIGSSSPNTRERGFIKPPTPYDQANPMFQSVNALSRTVLHRSNALPLDYLDDLESFYYVIAWLALAYIGPGRRLSRQDFPDVLKHWASDPYSRKAVLKKQEILLGDGFGCNNLNVCVFLCGRTTERFLRKLHGILRARYREKLYFGRAMTWEEMSKASEVAYGEFLWEIQSMIGILDDMERSKRSHAMIVSHGGLFPDDLKILKKRYETMGYKFDEEPDW
ncbi:hypothetical protein CPB84DRAFT_1844736 [Gymnopilus junonius]|uniref:Fungal-type protein kinase domain-containing protein n=1 Tax=Gymnopilus junonius TaxID=109634 RepID=A0A9P5TPX9_GYMJU|nr:hypothetical protein CPB84DRAFT_1844736 [Gymnopilus junonius]